MCNISYRPCRQSAAAVTLCTHCHCQYTIHYHCTQTVTLSSSTHWAHWQYPPTMYVYIAVTVYIHPPGLLANGDCLPNCMGMCTCILLYWRLHDTDHDVDLIPFYIFWVIVSGVMCTVYTPCINLTHPIDEMMDHYTGVGEGKRSQPATREWEQELNHICGALKYTSCSYLHVSPAGKPK